MGVPGEIRVDVKSKMTPQVARLIESSLGWDEGLMYVCI